MVLHHLDEQLWILGKNHLAGAGICPPTIVVRSLASVRFISSTSLIMLGSHMAVTMWKYDLQQLAWGCNFVS